MYRGSYALPGSVFDENVVDCGSQREDVEDVDVVVFPFRPPLSKVQELKGKECTAGREISSGSKVAQEVSALPSGVPLHC